jgi:hypothetical protein
VLSGAGFAFASATGLFLLWHQVLSRASFLSKTWQSETPGLNALRVGGIVALCAVLLVGTYLLANMRHGMAGGVSLYWQNQQGQQSAADMNQGVFVFLALIVPFAAAYLHHRLDQSTYWQRRRDITLKQEQWDLKEEERILAAEGLADRRALRQQKRERLEQERTLFQNQRQAVAERAQAAQRTHREHLEQAQNATAVYARSLLAALQQDRYYYLRMVKSRKDHLVPEQGRRHTTDLSQAPLPFVHALLPVGDNGQST